MLDLNEPLWRKLDDAYRDRDIPGILRNLAAEWDNEVASSLFYGCLCHQQTCYGATYATVPHLLAIAEPQQNSSQRLEIAVFLATVTLCAFDPIIQGSGVGQLQGLPLSLEGWDQKLDAFRSLARIFEDPAYDISDFEREQQLQRCQKVLGVLPVNEDDLAKINLIEQDFITSLGDIRTLCERTYLENIEDENALTHLLSGIAATEGLRDLANLLSNGTDGVLTCAACGWQYDYILFDERVAIYLDDFEPGTTIARSPADDASLKDYKDGSPTRSDGFLTPMGKTEDVADDRIKALLTFADMAPSTTPSVLLRNFLGRFECSKCRTSVAIKGG